MHATEDDHQKNKKQSYFTLQKRCKLSQIEYLQISVSASLNYVKILINISNSLDVAYIFQYSNDILQWLHNLLTIKHYSGSIILDSPIEEASSYWLDFES